MALVIYPEEGWNSFVTIAEATAGLHEISDGVAWDALTVEEQEQMLVTSALLLSSVATPSDSCNFAQAQILLVQFDLQNNGKYLSFVTTPDGEYTRAKVGPLEVEYNLGGSDTGMASGAGGLPDMVLGILSDCLIVGENKVTGFHLVF